RAPTTAPRLPSPGACGGAPARRRLSWDSDRGEGQGLDWTCEFLPCQDPRRARNASHSDGPRQTRVTVLSTCFASVATRRWTAPRDTNSLIIARSCIERNVRAALVGAARR